VSEHGIIKKRHRKVPAQVVLDLLAEVPPSERGRTRILDVPCGHAVIALPLSLAGFQVTGCDLFPEVAQRVLDELTPERLPSLLRDYWSAHRPPLLVQELLANLPRNLAKPTLSQGDMTERLPYPDGAFDVAITLEGVEHIDTLEAFLKEMRRVTRAGGRLILSTPNILCLRSRLAYALIGQRTLATFIDEHTAVQARDGDRLYHGHVFLVDYFELRYLLHHSGFTITRALPSRLSFSSILLAPLLLPWVALFSWLAPRRSRRRFRKLQQSGEVPANTPEPYPTILRHVLSSALLFGKNLILEAEAQ
jgi:SAM-dependent methyltransferase